MDGIFPEIAVKTAHHEANIAGLCILISDQTLTPIHIRLRAAVSSDAIVSLKCCLGESGPNGMVRVPYGSNRVSKIAVANRLDVIEWTYRVMFGTGEP